MTKLTKTSLFKASKPRNETPMEKTTRAVREILASEADTQNAKTARLRKARMERDASTPATPPAAKPKTVRKKVVAKGAK